MQYIYCLSLTLMWRCERLVTSDPPGDGWSGESDLLMAGSLCSD